MPQITQLGRVMVPVSDQDAAIAFYTSKLGFSLVADLPFGESAGSKSRRPAAGPPSRWCLRAVPLLFSFRDHDANQLMIVEGQ